MAMLAIMVNGIVDRGFDIKFHVPSWFTRTPISIKKAILSPTENKIVSTLLDISSLTNLKRTKPGTNMKKRKPKICRANGTSNTIVIHTIA
jgi:hypothetical protein